MEVLENNSMHSFPRKYELHASAALDTGKNDVSLHKNLDVPQGDLKLVLASDKLQTHSS